MNTSMNTLAGLASDPVSQRYLRSLGEQLDWLSMRDSKVLLTFQRETARCRAANYGRAQQIMFASLAALRQGYEIIHKVSIYNPHIVRISADICAAVGIGMFSLASLVWHHTGAERATCHFLEASMYLDSSVTRYREAPGPQPAYVGPIEKTLASVQNFLDTY